MATTIRTRGLHDRVAVSTRKSAPLRVGALLTDSHTGKVERRDHSFGPVPTPRPTGGFHPDPATRDGEARTASSEDQGSAGRPSRGALTHASDPRTVLFLQRLVGNGAVTRLLLERTRGQAGPAAGLLVQRTIDLAVIEGYVRDAVVAAKNSRIDTGDAYRDELWEMVDPKLAGHPERDPNDDVVSQRLIGQATSAWEALDLLRKCRAWSEAERITGPEMDEDLKRLPAIAAKLSAGGLAEIAGAITGLKEKRHQHKALKQLGVFVNNGYDDWASVAVGAAKGTIASIITFRNPSSSPSSSRS